MVSKSRLFSKILGEGTAGTIPVESLSTSIPLGVEDYSSVINLPLSGNNIGDQAFVSENNRLYIWTGVGWYSIALINQTPAWDSGGQPLSSYTLDADSPQQSTIISLSATDPEGLPISYSYITGGSMDSMATVSQDSSVITITPNTLGQLGPGTYTGTITFRASDGVNLASALSEFTLSFVTTVENSRYTSALITTNGTTGSNNVITDSSPNNYTITNTTNYAQITSFSPYRSGGYSWFFDGTGDYISTPSDAITIGTNDFTYEAWIYPTLNQGWGAIISPVYGTGGIGLFYNSGNLTAYGSGTLLSWTGILQLNVWQHVAFTRENNVLYLYHNGVKYGTSAANTYNLINSLYNIGANGSGSENFGGYISNARIVNGTAIYTTTFTPPSEKLTNVTNTALLTCHLPYLRDESSNDHNLIITGDVFASPNTPFDYEEYNETLSQGSVYFDGANQFVQAGGSYPVGSSPFTLEGWLYPIDNSAAFIPIDLRDLNTNWPNGTYFYFDPGSGTFTITVDVNESGPLDIVTGTKSWGYKRWTHFALVRESTTTNGAKLYINGKLASTATLPSTTDVGSITLGSVASGGSRMKGYMADVRLTVGSALYSSNFTPPTEQVSSSGSTLHVTGGKTAHIIDKTNSAPVLLRNTTGYGAVLTGSSGASSDVTKYAGSSIKIDGANNNYYVLSPKLLTSQDFTVEAWIYLTYTSGAKYLLGNLNSSGTYSSGIECNISPTSMTVNFGTTSGSYTSHSYSTTFNANQWYHIAFEKTVQNYGTGPDRINFYVNGIANEGPSIASVQLGELPWVLGAYGEGAGSSFFQGYVEDVRFSNVSRYKGQNFTPPTAPLQI